MPDLEWTELGLAEFPVNIQSANGDELGPIGHMRGFFRPPVTSNYTFVVSSDDHSEVSPLKPCYMHSPNAVQG